MTPTNMLQGGHEPRFLVLRLDGRTQDPTRRYEVLDYSGADRGARVVLEKYADEVQAAGNHEYAAGLRKALNDPASAPPQHAAHWTLQVYTAVWTGEAGQPQVAVHPVLVGPDDPERDEQYHTALTDKAARQGHTPGTPLLTFAEAFEVNTLRSS